MLIDIEDEKISLSLKRLKPDPWLKKVENLKVGDLVQGTVSKIFPFGVLVKIEPDIEGFVYTDNKTFGDLEKLELDKNYTFQIKSIEPENHRIVLAITHEE
jgi:ribosomal protein S1